MSNADKTFRFFFDMMNKSNTIGFGLEALLRKNNIKRGELLDMLRERYKKRYAVKETLRIRIADAISGERHPGKQFLQDVENVINDARNINEV